MYILIKKPTEFANKVWSLGNRKQSKITPRFLHNRMKLFLTKKVESKAMTNLAM